MLSVLLLLVIAFLFLFRLYKKRSASVLPDEVPKSWLPMLEKSVSFYRGLSEQKKANFRLDILKFLSEVRVSGSKGVEVTVEDRLLVAASAVIPLFGFPMSTYQHLSEVILYPSSFDKDFNLGNKHEVITGMVGNGIMEGKMILSKPSLYMGFQNPGDRSNVGIHEFAHLFDKEDGSVDGIPPGLEDKQFAIPWISLVEKKIKDINENRSDINAYGATNTQEFFAVASEYFFENPERMKARHPALYEQLTAAYNQDLDEKSSIEGARQHSLGRNSPCPCGSGKKYKHCCLT